MSKLIRRCATCRAIEVYNEVIPLKNYWPEFFERLGYDFSDTNYLSRDCLTRVNGDVRRIKSIDAREILEWESRQLDYDTCS